MSQDQNSSNNRIYDKLDKLDEKFDRKFEKFDKKLDGMERELIVYNEQLKFHIEGVRQLKAENELLQNYINIETQKLQAEFAPIKKHVERIQSTMSSAKTITRWLSYTISTISVIAGLIYSILQITGKR